MTLENQCLNCFISCHYIKIHDALVPRVVSMHFIIIAWVCESYFKHDAVVREFNGKVVFKKIFFAYL